MSEEFDDEIGLESSDAFLCLFAIYSVDMLKAPLLFRHGWVQEVQQGESLVTRFSPKRLQAV